MSSKYAQRDDSIAVAKAIGIILVVMGHACATKNLGGTSHWQIDMNSFIYFFHMPLFFFLSGWFFRNDYLNKKKAFVKKKLKGLYVPYIKWVLFFAVTHNIFFALGLYGTAEGVEPASYSFYDIARNIVAGLCFKGGDQLIGGFWFIPILFFSAVYGLLFLYLLYLVEGKIMNMHAKDKVENAPPHQSIAIQINTIIGIVFFLLLASMLMKKGWSLDIFISPRSCLATAFFLTGFFFKQNESCFNKWKVSYVIISSLVLYGALYVRRVSMGSLTMWYDIPYYYLLGVIGTWMVVQLSRCFLKIMSKGILESLAYIGENTLIILALHFGCFKLINLLKIQYYGLNQPYGSFPIIADDPSGNSWAWYIAYVFVGVAIPIAVIRLWNLVKLKIWIKS